MKTLHDYIEKAKQVITEVSLEKGKALIEESIYILDVREPQEYLMGAIENALNIPRGILEPAADINYAGANPALRDHRHES